MTADIAAPKRNGLVVLWDTIVAPAAAFAEITIRSHWAWAMVVTSVLGMIGGFLQVAAAEHVTNYMFAHDPRFATMTPDQLATGKKIALALQHFVWLVAPFYVVISVAGSALVMLLANAIGRGTGTFMRFFSLAANVGCINLGLAYLLKGIVIASRGPESIQSPGELLDVLPTLGWLAPGAPPFVHGFLVGFGIAPIWSIVLLALGLQAIAGLKPAIAWGTPIVMTILGALYTATQVH